jgi:hypothetical protein
VRVVSQNDEPDQNECKLSCAIMSDAKVHGFLPMCRQNLAGQPQTP